MSHYGLYDELFWSPGKGTSLWHQTRPALQGTGLGTNLCCITYERAGSCRSKDRDGRRFRHALPARHSAGSYPDRPGLPGTDVYHIVVTLTVGSI